MIKLFLLLNLLLAEIIFSQSVTWEKIFSYTNNCAFRRIQQTNDLGYVSIGTSRLGIRQKLLFTKVNSNGDTLWNKFYDTKVDDGFEGYWVEKTVDQGFVIAGTGAPNSNAILIKTDSLGNIEWNKNFGGNSGIEQGMCVKQTSDKGFIIQCRTTGYSLNNDVLLIKTDSIGNIQWQELFDYGFDILPSGIDLFGNKGYFMLSTSYVVNNWSKIKLIYLNETGNVIWERDYQYNSLSSVANSIKYTTKKTIAISGEVITSRISYVLNIDTVGNIIWEEVYYINGFFESSRSLDESPNRGLICCGIADSISGDIRGGIIRLIDYEGKIIFEKLHFNEEFDINLRSVSVTNDKGFVFSGNVSNSQSSKGYILKTDSSGNVKPLLVTNNNIEHVESDRLFENFPNPFNSETIIRYNIDRTSNISISLYNVQGKKIVEFDYKNQPKGRYEVTFNAGNFNLSSGFYFGQIQIETYSKKYSEFIKMLYLK